MTALPTLKKSGLLLAIGLIVGGSAGGWIWWAMQLRWWIGLPVVLLAACLSRVWLGLQITPTDDARPRNMGLHIAASWICLLCPMIVIALFFLSVPMDLPPGKREAAATLAVQFLIPQAIAVLFGLASLWGIRCWQPVGVLIRSSIGICIAMGSAYLFTMAAVAMNLWH